MQAGLTQGARRSRPPTPSSPAHLPHQWLTQARSAPQNGHLRPEWGTRATWWLSRLSLQSLKQPRKGSGHQYQGASLYGPILLQSSR